MKANKKEKSTLLLSLDEVLEKVKSHESFRKRKATFMDGLSIDVRNELIRQGFTIRIGCPAPGITEVIW